MTRKLKRPDGAIYEEFIAWGSHEFADGEHVDSLIDTMDGNYSGRFFYQHLDGTQTRWYTTSNAPKWLLAMYVEATDPDKRREKGIT